MIPAHAVLSALPQTTITLRRFGETTINYHGEAETDSYEDTPIRAVVHPTGRRELERLQLDAARETISIVTRTEIRTVSTRRPDRVLYQGRWYEVKNVGDYASMGGVYLAHAQSLNDYETE